MWTIYDELIEEIPPECVVDEAVRGNHWTMVRSGKGVGLAMTLRDESRPRTLPDLCAGMPLRDLASAAKFWNFTDAALGVAAINAYRNSPERPPVQAALDRGEVIGAFEVWRNRAAGKKAAVIGHFPNLEQTLGDVCELYVLEKKPLPGDYPDSACEYLLPLMDFVFATGVTLINKTFPRLLALSQKCGLILVGPTVPLAPLLFDHGVRDLQGFVVTDPDLCHAIIAGKEPEKVIFDTGKRVSLTPEERT
jgi:uncharacterized protein (DUF4213/DUF364 family)